MNFNHPSFKQPAYLALSSGDKVSYMSYKLRDYFNRNNCHSMDSNGHNMAVMNHQVSVRDYYDSVCELFSGRELVAFAKFAKHIQLSDSVVRLLKNRDVERQFQKLFESCVGPVFKQLKEKAEEKKHAEAERMKAQQNMFDETLEKKKSEQRALRELDEEKRAKKQQFHDMVLEMGAEWED